MPPQQDDPGKAPTCQQFHPGGKTGYVASGDFVVWGDVPGRYEGKTATLWNKTPGPDEFYMLELYVDEGGLMRTEWVDGSDDCLIPMVVTSGSVLGKQAAGGGSAAAGPSSGGGARGGGVARRWPGEKGLRGRPPL